MSTDFLRLNQSALFAKVRGSTVEPQQHQHTKNLLECKDDLLYAWDAKDASLLALNWRAAQLKGFGEVKHQTLIPSSNLNFEVNRILCSNEGSLIALAGARGCAILELPRRWGPNGQFMEGKEKITCRSYNLDAHFFGNNPHLELRQLRWHPASPTDSHLLLLLSDNTIRVYNSSVLRHVWQVGPLPLKNDGNLNSSAGLSALALGEAAVDFDIAPAVKVSDPYAHIGAETSASLCASFNSSRNRSLSNQSLISSPAAAEKSINKNADKIEWPIVILRENGNIYVLMSGLDSMKPRLQGPLTITPATANNYGLDSCSLLIIPSLPPTLVIAESNGKLHHALLLQAEDVENSFNEVDASLMIHPSEWTIHVLETVELELGLPRQELLNSSYNCPLHLKRDFINELRYFAYHNTGLHVICINFIGELQRFLEEEAANDITNLNISSHAEYILCTKVDNADRLNVVLGFVLLQMPSGVILLLGSGQVISLKLVIDPRLLLDSAGSGNEPGKLNSNVALNATAAELEPNFLDHIKNILQRSVSQPILSLDKSAKPTPAECYELLVQAVEVLRTQYIERHDKVRVELNKRKNIIRLRKEQLQKDLEYLEKQRDEIREQAHMFAERFEEISEQHELQNKRCQDLVRQANTCLPSNPIAEKEFATEVERINNTTKNMANALQKAKENINKQTYHIAKYNETAKHKKIELPEKQERTIKEILMQLTGEIDGQIKEIKRINKIVGI